MAASSSNSNTVSTASGNELCQMLRWAAEEYRKNVKLGLQVPIVQELEKRTSVCISNIGDDGLAIFGTVVGQRSFPNLTTVSVVDCYLEKRVGIMMLSRSLTSGNLSRLETLSVSNSGIDDKDLVTLAGALGSGKCSSLKRLCLGGDRDIFQTRGARAIAEVLYSFEALPVLEDLSLRGVEEEEGMLAIFTALENRRVQQPGLNSLDFQRCSIRLGAASVLARALQYSPHFNGIVKLDLTGCRTMGDEEVIALSQAFRSKNMQHLFCLGLANLSMGERGFLEIASVLRAGHLPGLHYLYAIDCQMTQTSAKALIDAYSENKSLIADVAVDWPGFTYQNGAHFLMVRNETLLEQQTERGAGNVTALDEFDDQRSSSASSRPPSSVLFIVKKIRVSRWKITQMLFSIKKVLGKKKSRILLRIASLRSPSMMTDHLHERTKPPPAVTVSS